MQNTIDVSLNVFAGFFSIITYLSSSAFYFSFFYSFLSVALTKQAIRRVFKTSKRLHHTL